MTNPTDTSLHAVWQLHDAKAQFSLVVDSALRGVPQHISKHGKRAVVVVSELDYLVMERSARAQAPGFKGHLLALPKTPATKGRAAVKLSGAASRKESARPSLALREVDF